MKRVGYLYSKIYSMENLELAHKNARKGKTWYKEVKEIDNNKELYLTNLQTQLMDGTYKTSEYKVFTKQDSGKTREIYKLPYYPDRVCQWAILQVINETLLKAMTSDTYSAIPGRGIHLALKKIKKAMKKDPVGTQYCLKLDISKYYPSINQEILKSLLARKFKDPQLLDLLYEIIESTNKGIPIGNYLSQWFGNFYLCEFEHWLKEQKHVKYLYIYMDDIVILSNSKSFLRSLFRDMQYYLSVNLDLTVKSNWQIFKVKSRGIDSLGYRIFHTHILLRKSICKKFKKKAITIMKKSQINFKDWARNE